MKHLRKTSVMHREDLQNLCIKNRWFTCGTNKQYEKLFDMVNELNKNAAVWQGTTETSDLADMAVYIGTCSEMFEDEEIANIMYHLNKIIVTTFEVEQ